MSTGNSQLGEQDLRDKFTLTFQSLQTFEFLPLTVYLAFQIYLTPATFDSCFNIQPKLLEPFLTPWAAALNPEFLLRVPIFVIQPDTTLCSFYHYPQGP